MKNVRIIAYHLPQFHTVEENDLWWGKGFTEWTNVRRAKPLYKNHQQPKTPLGNNYYNLLEKKTVNWQAELCNSFGIFGFCYYHYWFSGRKILEKPLENLLEWKDIDQKFCFCWANHDWNRSWEGTRKLLIEQTYGGEEEWQAHIAYLLPFFRDRRYIRIDDKPIFVIYDSQSVPNLEARLSFYQRVSKENGLPGIYFISSRNSRSQAPCSPSMSAEVLREPGYTWSQLHLSRFVNRLKRALGVGVSKIGYRRIQSRILKNYEPTNRTILPGIFVRWDTTPRHGKRGTVMVGASPKTFFEFLEKFRMRLQHDVVFVNAWNEWAEGMYLEPDEETQFEYLRVLSRAFLEDPSIGGVEE